MISHLLSLALAMVVIAVWVGGVSPMALLLPVYMLLLGMFAIGVGWVVASLQVYLRDTAQVLMVLMTLWFWITPIFISEEHVPPEFRFLIRLQSARLRCPRLPRASFVVSRSGIYGELLILTAYAVAAFFIGGLFFRHLKRGFADVL